MLNVRLTSVTPADGPSGKLAILVVDDESELREQLSHVFAREGHQVTTVADGRGDR